MTLGHTMRDLPRRDLQRRIEVDDSMTLVVVRVAGRPAHAQGKRQLRALQRLNRGLLVDAQHHGMLGRVEVETDDVVDLGDELRVPTDLVRSDKMRLEPVLAEDIGDAPARQTRLFAKQARRPPTAPSRRRRHRQLHDTVLRLRGDRMILSSRPRPYQPPHPTRAEPPADRRDVLRR